MAVATKRAPVLDTSAAMSWLVEAELDDDARSMASEVCDRGAAVPTLFRWELQNALAVAVRRGRCTNEIMDASLRRVSALPLVVDTEIAKMPLTLGLDLMRRFSLSAYDACYLELAIRLRRPLMTRDQRLAHAAGEMDVLWERLF